MAWENTLLASRILPPSYSPPMDLANNRSQESSLSLEQDGRLTLLVILTTAAGLAVVLLLFILLRIGCLQGKICFTRYKDRHHDRSPCLLPSSATTAATGASALLSDENQPTKSPTVIPQQSTAIQEVNPSDCAVEEVSTTVIHSEAAQSKAINGPLAAVDESGFSHLRTWLQMMKDNDSLCNHPSETKSLTSSPSSRYFPALNDRREQALANQRQQILDRFGQQQKRLQHRSPTAVGFGFTQSRSSCFDVDEAAGLYSYSYGNQVEYMGGQYGCVEPFYRPRMAGPNDQEPTNSENTKQTSSADGTKTVTGFSQPNFVRSAESLLVFTRERYSPSQL